MTKTVLITGCSTGIGLASAKFFLKNDWNVVATMRNASCAAAESLATASSALVLTLDVCDRASVESAVRAAIERFGAIDVLVNNAGFAVFGPMEYVSEEQMKRQYDTNVFGAIRVIQAVLPHMRRRGSGVIVNVSSSGGKVTIPYCSIYHGSKFALEGMSECLAMEVAAHGVQVRLVEPGPVNTNFMANLDVAVSETNNSYDALTEKMMEHVASVMGAADDVGPSVQMIFKAATDKGECMRYVAGKFAEEAIAKRKAVSDEEHLRYNKKQWFNIDN